MGKKPIKIRTKKKKIVKELDTDELLIKVREQLLEDIYFPFVFLKDDEETDIPKEDESTTKLKDILDGKNLYLKIKRTMLGEKIKSKDGFDFYVYPQKELNDIEKKCSTNIMVIGETGVGKSTWLHCFINYLQGIQIEENNIFYLFNEQNLQEEYGKKYGKKSNVYNLIDKPAIYNIGPTILSNNPIRLIDTAGFDNGDIRGKAFNEQIIKDIQELLTKEIESLNAICLLFKATEKWALNNAKLFLDKLFSLFGKEIIKNLVIVFTFVDDFDDIPALNTLADKNSPFIKILGNINELPHFEFNNIAYFSKYKEDFEKIFGYNSENFRKLLEKVSKYKQTSLESSKEVIQ